MMPTDDGLTARSLVFCSEHIFHLGVHLIIPKTHQAITLLVEKSRSRGILALLPGLCMLTAVEFDNQASRDAAEIGEVGTNAVLAAEFESRKALGSEVLPQLVLLIRAFSPKPPASIA